MSGLNVVIGATVDSAVSGIRQVGSEFNKLPASVTTANTALGNFGKTINTASSAITVLAQRLKTNLADFKVVGEAGQLAGSKLGSLTGALQTTASTIPAVTQAAGGLGSSLLSLGKSLISSQIGMVGLAAGAIALVESIFKGSESFKDIDLSAATFEGTLKRLKDELADFKNELDFSDKIRNIKNQLNGLSGTSLKLAGAGDTGITDAKVIGKIDSQVTELRKSQADLIKIRLEAEQAFAALSGGSSTKLGKLLVTGIKVEDINGPLIKQLDEDDQVIVKKYQDTNDRINALLKQRGATSQDITLKAKGQLLDIYNQQKEDEKKVEDDAKKARDKSASEYAKYVSETISKGKQLAAFFEGRRVVENFTIFDTKGETFNKALKQIKDFEDGVMKIIPDLVIPVKISTPDLRLALPENGFNNELQSRKIDLSVPIKLIPTIPKPALTNFEKETEKLISDINKIIEGLSVDSLTNIGEAIGTALSGGDLGNVFKEFGNIIGSGLQAIGKEIISIGIAALLAKEALKKLFSNPGIAIAAGIALVAAGAALKGVLNKGIPGRAAGGAVSAGQLYEVGERGRELFRPSTSGTIIPAHQTGLQGAAIPIINFNGEFAISGNQLRLLLSRTDRYQGRNV